MTPAGDERRVSGDRVIDRLGEGREHAAREQRQLAAAEIAGRAHDPVVVDRDVLHDVRNVVDDNTLETAARERIGRLPWFAVLNAREQLVNRPGDGYRPDLRRRGGHRRAASAISAWSAAPHLPPHQARSRVIRPSTT